MRFGRIKSHVANVDATASLLSSLALGRAGLQWRLRRRAILGIVLSSLKSIINSFSVKSVLAVLIFVSGRHSLGEVTGQRQNAGGLLVGFADLHGHGSDLLAGHSDEPRRGTRCAESCSPDAMPSFVVSESQSARVVLGVYLTC